MKKKNEKGFFLSETILVITVVAVILLGVFKLFSSVYYGFKESENYNTVNAINALSNVQKYYESIGDIDTSLLSETNTYIDFTNEIKYASDYYTRIKEEFNITNVYLIDLNYFFNSNDINNFSVLLRRYMKTLKNIEGIVMVIVVNGNEFSYVKVGNAIHIELVGDKDDEYGVYLNVGETFEDPGYTGWNGDAPNIEWENDNILNINKPGTYYLHYDFDGYIFRRKVMVGNYNAEFSYTGGEQEYRVNAPGYYKIEVWGAQGGNAGSYPGGYGGYAIGKIKLQKNEQLYINVGGVGSSTSSGVSSLILGGYNGGGSTGGQSCCGRIYGSGGGATHIAIVSGELVNLDMYKGELYSNGLTSNSAEILIVAGGGGGSYYGTNSGTEGLIGGSGGGYNGGNGVESTISENQYCAGLGGTQLSGGSISTSCSQTSNYNGLVTGFFGQGGTSSGATTGGGGGYYGGSRSGHIAPAGGGSGYIGNTNLIDKYMYCYNCTTSDEVDTKTYTTTCVEKTPTENCAKIGNGYAKITFLGTNYISE